MSSEPASDDVLVQLRQQARQLVTEVAGPLRRLSLRSGNVAVEIEWHAAWPVPVEPDAAGPAPLVVPEVQAGTEGRVMVVSPIVGTFYRAPEPGAVPFVEVGDVVEAGQVIGIIEAMKLMNHITAEQAGKVAEVLVRDGEPVEFDQALVALVPA